MTNFEKEWRQTRLYKLKTTTFTGAFFGACFSGLFFYSAIYHSKRDSLPQKLLMKSKKTLV